MRESFVFHFEYLNDVPEELQSTWAMYVINYARYGDEPELTDWRDIRIWNKTKSRIEEDTEKYERKCKNLKNYQQKKTAPNQTEKKSDWQAEAVRETLKNEREAMIEQYEPIENSEQLAAYSNEPAEEKKELQKKKRFERPSVEEVTEYCNERNNGIDAQQFVDFYESKGWKIGHEPMKDWRACVRTWEKRHTPHTDPPRQMLPADRLTL